MAVYIDEPSGDTLSLVGTVGHHGRRIIPVVTFVPSGSISVWRSSLKRYSRELGAGVGLFDVGVIWSAETGGDASGERSVHVLLHDGDDEGNIGPFSHDGVIQRGRLSNTFSHHILEPSNSACIERPAKGFSHDIFLKSFIGVLLPSHRSIYGSVVGPLPIA